MNTRQIRNALVYTLTIFILFAWLSAAYAGDFHKQPYKFLFGNHIDTHQETQLIKSGNIPVSLSGFFYIIFTGEIDPVSLLPIAEHPSGDECEDEADGIDCVVGWVMDGLPGEAKFLYHSGVNGNDHPVWLLNRTDVPQPGSYTHFHWIGKDSKDPRAPKEVPDQCDVDMAGQLDFNAENVVCPGWFLQITAVEEFAFQHGGEVVPVRLGIDNATHLNLVSNYDEVSGIDPTR